MIGHKVCYRYCVAARAASLSMISHDRVAPAPTATVCGMVTCAWYDPRSDADSLADLLDERGRDFAHRAWAVRERRGPHRPTIVARREGRVVGYVVGHFDSEFHERFPVDYVPGQAWVDELCVAEGHRREGVGSALMGAFVAEALTHECMYAACILDLSSDPSEQFSFFQSLGFLPLIPDDPTDAVCAPACAVLERVPLSAPPARRSSVQVDTDGTINSAP